MASFSDKPGKRSTKPRSVVFVVYPDIKLLDLVGPLQVFSDVHHYVVEPDPYTISIVSLDGGKIETDTLISIDTEPMSKWFRRSIHTLVIAGGMGTVPATENARFIGKVETLNSNAERICSVCSGALILAATGILNGRRAVTHWEDCGQLAEQYPEVNVEIDPIFVKDGNIWTSAGITAGIDLALALVGEDMGKPVALEIARNLVTYMVRPGGQSQFSTALNRQTMDTSERFTELHDWIADNLQHDLRVEQLAGRVNMSTRNFSRVYTSQMGRTPAKAVEALRLEAARQLLETTALPIKSVAAQCGFADDERMRRAFMRALQIAPNDYRQRFQIGKTSSASP